MSIRTRLQDIFKELELNKTDARVFLASLEIDSGSASDIARIANLNRITTYESLKRLSKKGLMKIRVKKNTSSRYFVPEDIATIEEKLRDKAAEIQTQLDHMGNLKEEFRTRFASSPQKPEVLYYESLNGIKSVLLDSLKQNPREIISFASRESLEIGFDQKFLQDYWNKRVKKGIPSRGIIPKTEKAMQFFCSEKNTKELRAVRFLDEKIYQYKNEIDIYGNNISIISLTKDNEHGVIIRSKSLAESMRAVFETLWHLAEQKS